MYYQDFQCKEPFSGRTRVIKNKRPPSKESRPSSSCNSLHTRLKYNAYATSDQVEIGYVVRIWEFWTKGINSRITVWMSAECHNNKSQLIQLMATGGGGDGDGAQWRNEAGIPSALTKFKHLTPSGRCQQIPLDPWVMVHRPSTSDIPLKTKQTGWTKKKEYNEMKKCRTKKKQ